MGSQKHELFRMLKRLRAKTSFLSLVKTTQGHTQSWGKCLRTVAFRTFPVSTERCLLLRGWRTPHTCFWLAKGILAAGRRTHVEIFRGLTFLLSRGSFFLASNFFHLWCLQSHNVWIITYSSHTGSLIQQFFFLILGYNVKWAVFYYQLEKLNL